MITATSGGTVPVYPAQRIGPCTAARYGEITAVISAPKPTVVKGDANSYYLDDPNQDSCVPPTVRYVGMTMQPIHRFWQTGLHVNIALSRPSRRQQAAGKRWAACIVTLQLPQPAAATATAPAVTAPQYGGSIRDALHTGQQRDQLGSCVPDLGWNSPGLPQLHQLHRPIAPGSRRVQAYTFECNEPAKRVAVAMANHVPDGACCRSPGDGRRSVDRRAAGQRHRCPSDAALQPAVPTH